MAKFDFSQIPAVERRKLGKTFLGAVERFYSDPENIRRFEEWKKSQEVHNADQRRKTHDKRDNGGGCAGIGGGCGFNRKEPCVL